MSTWIGSEDKNLAWDLLCEAKKVYDDGFGGLVITIHRKAYKVLIGCIA